MRTFSVVVVVILCLAACTSGSDEAATTWCSDGEAAAAAIEGIERRTDLPTAAALRSDLDAAEEALDRAAKTAPEAVVASVEVLAEALEAYRAAAEAADYDLLAAQTQGSTEDHEALLGLDADDSLAAVVVIERELANCTT